MLPDVTLYYIMLWQVILANMNMPLHTFFSQGKIRNTMGGGFNSGYFGT